LFEILTRHTLISKTVNLTSKAYIRNVVKKVYIRLNKHPFSCRFEQEQTTRITQS